MRSNEIFMTFYHVFSLSFLFPRSSFFIFSPSTHIPPSTPIFYKNIYLKKTAVFIVKFIYDRIKYSLPILLKYVINKGVSEKVGMGQNPGVLGGWGALFVPIF